MDINGVNSCSNGSQPSGGSKNVNEDKKFTEKDACDSLYVNQGL